MRSIEEQNQAAANELLNSAMSYARKVLRGYGEIGPFAFTMNADGSVSRETMDRPQLPADPAGIWKILHDHLATRAHRGEIEASAEAASVILAQASQEGYSDALIFQIERQGGYAVKVTVPYRIYGGQLWNVIPRRVAVGNVIMQEIPATIFTAEARSAK
ncbi:MAG TPA: hypothetical protein VF730_09810 [Terracidiphilus sp.]